MQPDQFLHWKFSPKKGFVTPGIEQNPEQPCSLTVHQHYGKGQPIVCHHRLCQCWAALCAWDSFPSSNLLKTFTIPMASLP